MAMQFGEVKERAESLCVDRGMKIHLRMGRPVLD